MKVLRSWRECTGVSWRPTVRYVGALTRLCCHAPSTSRFSSKQLRAVLGFRKIASHQARGERRASALLWPTLSCRQHEAQPGRPRARTLADASGFRVRVRCDKASNRYRIPSGDETFAAKRAAFLVEVGAPLALQPPELAQRVLLVLAPITSGATRT